MSVAPALTEVVQVVPQFIPVPNTVPEPVPVRLTVKRKLPLPALVNVAVTFEAALPETVQEPIPVHAPLHPVNVEPVAGVATNVTCVPELTSAVQVPPQLIAPPVTVPVPVPAL